MARRNADKLPFDPALCQFCFEKDDALKKCSRCKIMVYCSKEHQSLDWKNHKKLCITMADAREELTYDVEDYEGLRKYKIMLKLFWEERLRRKLDFYEQSVWLGFEFCGICFKTEGLRLCDVCFSEGWCCNEHRYRNVKHKVYCKELKMCREIDRFVGNTIVLIDDWYQGLTSFDHPLPTDIYQLVDLGDTPDELYKRIYGHLLSPLGTLIFALKTNNLSSSNLKIHIVGASIEETKYNWSMTSNLILKFFPEITSLNFHFIGPELPTSFSSFNFMPTNLNSTFQFHQQCYHTTNLNPPDLIVLYNAGLHEYPIDSNPWTPSLPTIVNQNSPIVLTGYMEEEVRKDKEILLGENSRLQTVFLGKNPFFSPKPFRNWDSAESVYYSNNYIYMAKNAGGES